MTTTAPTPASPSEEQAVSWDKPGPGTWELDSSHTGPAPGPMVRDLLKHGLESGMAEGMALFGAPLGGMALEFVNGKFYRRLVPLIGANAEPRPLPKPALWLGSRLIPAFRRAERQAKETWDTRRWLAEIAWWEDELKPELTATNRRLSEVDPDALDGPRLAAHIDEIVTHLRRTLPLHFRLHVSDMGPLGYLMVCLDEWGLDGDEAYDALVAASPATRAPAEALRAVADAVRAAGRDPEAVTSLDDIRDASPDAAQELDGYLAEHGWRLTTGYDLEDQCLVELPEVVVAGVRHAATATGIDAERARADAALAGLRARVPEAHHDDFDWVTADARASYGLRDENGPLTYEWPAGILRRALLAAGRHLAAAGVLVETGEIFELDFDEVDTALRTGGIDRPAIDARKAERRWWATLSGPARLGPEEAIPPVDALPEGLARATKVVLRVVGALESATGADADPLSGLGIGTESFRGTARVVHDASEALARVEPGDVMVVPFTVPTFNAVLAMAGAVVTAEGGLMCHAAVIARELGLPAVIGARGAMADIPDGATVEVDPAAGRVRVL